MHIIKQVTARLLSLLLVMLLASAAPAASAASAAELTPSIKAAFDLTAAKTDDTTRARLNTLYSELSVLKTEFNNREAQIRTLHYSNEQTLTAVRGQIKQIDQAAISRLELNVSSVKQRYQPLFDQYTALNRQMKLAKGLKNKTLNSLLRNQADAMKILVQIAKQNIRDEQEALKTAKAVRTHRISAARKTLDGISTPQTAIKAQKSAVTALNKRLSADWGSFTSAIRKQNAPLTLQSLSSLVSGYRQMAAYKQKIITLEQKVAEVIQNTKRQIGA
ncbi:hypothetical protein GCM10010912_08410 [Paenibacillus albidus]|uniref:Uncharacterized protein n=1 Tax=Paenibacillus albidus TaxID=2041023 RepID=A0A917C1M7_9BACL|nr:hypothetical protein [Paenibacillus albidus]GGF65680.1 hypothetical protein GCM10010912_08410 [Paenibacillus albidus]